jgi:hypothetical protein
VKNPPFKPCHENKHLKDQTQNPNPNEVVVIIIITIDPEDEKAF